MPSALQEGVLVSCNAPLRQFILHVDEELSKEGGQNSLLIESDLDDTHLLVKSDAVALIQQKIEELMKKNHYTRPVESKELEPDDVDAAAVAADVDSGDDGGSGVPPPKRKQKALAE